MQFATRKTLFGASAALALSTASGLAVAQDSEREIGVWNGTASFGANFSSGNSESSSINGALRLIRSTRRWDHVFSAALFRGESTVVVQQTDATGAPVVDANGFPVNDIVTGVNSDRVSLGYQPKFFFSDKLYLFGIIDWETDEPANIDVSTRQVVGAGYSFFSGDSGYLTAELGVGNRTLDPVVGDNLDGAIGYLGVNYLNRLNDFVTFNSDLRADFGGDNTFVELALGAAFKVSTRFSVKINHFIRGNTDLEDFTNPLDSGTDNVTTINLVLDI